MTKRTNRNEPTTVRCAIYTRKSTDEGLEQEFNSLDAQRESGEHYIRAQEGQGWVYLPTRYDDGGFTGGNMERPALQRLLADIEAGKIDCVVVYKVDRLSRSLLDFSRIMETFDKHGISFVSVTQQFNTSTSMGRLMLNVLLSFAQFEREIISERTRDKMAAARRKGKYVGGAPILGYDIDRDASRLVVNEQEAVRVRQIFELYLELQSLIPTIAELAVGLFLLLGWITAYQNAVNDGAVRVEGITYASRTLKLKGLRISSWQVENRTRFRTVSFELHFRSQGWTRRILNRGYHELVLVRTRNQQGRTIRRRKLVPILIHGERPSEPAFLDRSGQRPRDSGTLATFFETEITQSA